MFSMPDLLAHHAAVLVIVIVVLCGAALFGRRRLRLRARIVLALLCGSDPVQAAAAESFSVNTEGNRTLAR